MLQQQQKSLKPKKARPSTAKPVKATSSYGKFIQQQTQLSSRDTRNRPSNRPSTAKPKSKSKKP